PNGPHRCLKKNALEAGIRASQSDLIFTTDADCRPPQTWVASTVSCFEPGIGLVAGYAPLLPGTNRLSNLLSLQALVVSALAAGSFGIGFPLSCSGRNLAYRRTAFTDAGGFAPIGHIRGGDDVLLMRQIASHTPWNLRFNPDANAGVPSAVHEDSLFHRHVRYQSKAIHYGIRVLILAGTVYIFHLTLAGAILAAWLHPEARPFAALLWALKILADIGFLWKAASLFKARPTLKWFPLLELIAVPYVVLFSALGTLKPSRWK
ncbi:MAG: hypothetical protein O2954_16185, partial [bacterium]|nr:hypothetical protein [bacterium]